MIYIHVQLFQSFISAIVATRVGTDYVALIIVMITQINCITCCMSLNTFYSLNYYCKCIM